VPTPASSNLAPTESCRPRPVSLEAPGASSAEPGITEPKVARVAAIIVTWNRKADVLAVVEAIKRQTFDVAQLDVVVVDNASTDGTSEALCAAFKPERVVENPTDAAHEPRFVEPLSVKSDGGHEPKRNAVGFRSLTIVRNEQNLGGCGGFNTGFAYVERFLAERDSATSASDPDYVWLVDDDIDLPTDALKQLVRTAESDKTIGLVGSRAVDFNDRSTTIETTIYFDRERGRMHDTPLPSSPHHDAHTSWIKGVVGTKGPNSGPFAGVRDVDVVSACSMLARWEAICEVGYWDYRYFIYCDDADWCLRFAARGYRVVCDLDAVVFHTPWYQKLTPARLYYSQRNIVWLIQKTFPPMRLKYATFRWLASILNDCLRAALHRRIFHAEIIRRTAADIVANRGGKLDHDGPSRSDVVEQLNTIGAMRGNQTIAVLCPSTDAVRWADELRGTVEADAVASGDGPRWVYVIRNDVNLEGCSTDEVERVIYSRRLRSKLFRQLAFVRRPRAVVVFDQTNDFPLLRGRHNVHIDRKWPGQAQVERDGLGPRLAFGVRWGATCLASVWYALTVRPYKSPHKFG
jgi:GT2 family glycosyltransferase